MDKYIQQLSVLEEFPDIIYMSVGCSANLNSKMLNHLEKKDMQQYPPFLSDFHDKHPEASMLLILIDPSLETPSDCTKYVKGDVIVKEFREYVKYGDAVDEYTIGFTNIVPIVNDVVSQCIKNKSLFCFHDFTGMQIPVHLFDETKESERVCIDISRGTDYGCYIDLEKDTNYPIIYNDRHNKMY